MPSERLRLSALYAGLRRRGLTDEADAIRREMNAARCREAIQFALSAPCPPDAAQRRELAALLTRDDLGSDAAAG